jgi:pimeloyl-ACP methyl ester carboxylesterase
VAVDLPGFGVAPDPPEPWSTLEYARFVAPVLDELGPGPVVVLGHSFGARVAVHLAALSAARVGALVLTGAPLAPASGGRPAPPAVLYRLGRALNRAKLLPDAVMERLRQKYGSEDYRQADEVMRGVLVKAVAETAQSAYVPALRSWAPRGGALELVWGERDRETSLSAALRALARPPEVAASVTVVTDAGHLINKELAEQVRAAVLRHRPAS